MTVDRTDEQTIRDALDAALKERSAGIAPTDVFERVVDARWALGRLVASSEEEFERFRETSDAVMQRALAAEGEVARLSAEVYEAVRELRRWRASDDPDRVTILRLEGILGTTGDVSSPPVSASSVVLAEKEASEPGGTP